MTMTDSQTAVTHLADADLTDQPAGGLGVDDSTPADIAAPANTMSVSTGPTPTAAAATGAVGVDLVQVPAADVVIEDNVRTAADLDAAFLASVKRHGVLLPTIGYRNADGAVVVRDGQMRVLAAREAGRDVPVVLTAREDSTAVRVAEQLVANERRTALTDGDRLAAYRQLEFEGLSVTAIARETGTKRDTVKQTLTVAKSDTATKVVTDQALTLDDALLFAEFDDDPDALEELQGCVDDGYADELPLVAERLRQNRERKIAVAALAAEWAAKGVRVVAHDEDDYEHLSSLTDAPADATDRPGVDADVHAAGCVGHAVMIRPWGTHEAVPVCTTPGEHRPRYVHHTAGNRTTATATTLSGEDAAAVKEAEKVERRRVRVNNQAWDAADTLRREFVTSLLQRKSLPKGWHLFAAVAATRHGITVRNDMSAGVRTLLGIDPDNTHGTTGVADWVEQYPTKAGHVTLAFFLSAFEHAADRSWWRYGSETGAFYLNQLQTWGYRLSEVERLAAGLTTTDGDVDADADVDAVADTATAVG